jgi:NTP pyrophosphatase (non-canonical NTP hydrolase)
MSEGKITPTMYQAACRRTDRDSYWSLAQEIEKTDPNELRLLHMAVGVSGEAGELLDAVKKAVFYRKKLDVENMKEEIGDILWYLSNLLTSIGSNYEEVMQKNYAKLMERYPDGYSNKSAQERRDKTNGVDGSARNS